MRKLVSLLLCAAALLSGCARGGESQQGTGVQPVLPGPDLGVRPRHDAHRAETVYLEEDLGTTALAEALVGNCWKGLPTLRWKTPFPPGPACCLWNSTAPTPRWTCPPITAPSPAWH